MSQSGISCDKKIAITGMACRFPGAEDLPAYWQLIKNNRIATRQSAPSALPADYCRRWLAGGFICDVDQFDAEFFSISNREAQLMDPQQRLVLQHVWHAIEDAGIAPQSLRGSKTGVFVGAMANDWATRSINDDDAFNSQMITGNGLALIANRVSYLYDFKGPSLSLDSACSSSLVAINYAAQALRNGDCDYALVAGVNVIATPTLQQFYQRSGIASAKGQCQPFSRYSDGIVRGEGVGVLLLQRLEDETRAYALLEGCALNHNGQSNGLSAPNRFSQQTLLTQTYRQWGISPAEIDYVECHGTGTELGDRIELQALNKVLNVPERRHPCHIGSVKGLIGHTEAAAGIAGTIKLALILHHGYVPASLYADTPNAILEKNATLKLPPLGYPLEEGRRHRVALSSFGLGGTNGHLVLQRALASTHQSDDRDRPHLFVLSAPSVETLVDQARSLSNFLDNHPDYAFSTLAAESRRVKSLHRVKKAWVASSTEALHKQLHQFLLNPIVAKTLNTSTSLYLAAHPASSRTFSQTQFNHYPLFRQAIERCDSLFYPLLGHSIIALMFAVDSTLSPTQQNLWLPALFTWNYAQAELWASEGVQVSSFIGEGIGEYVAATLSGLLLLEEAVYLLAQHAEILHLQQVIPGHDFQLEATAPYEKFQQYFCTIPEREAHAPFISCLHGRLITRLPAFNEWLQLFSTGHSPETGLKTALEACDSNLILASSAAPAERGKQRWISEDESVPDALQQHLLTLAQLYEHGATLALQAESLPFGRSRLPAYRFRTASFWLEPVGNVATERPNATQHAAAQTQDASEFVYATLASVLACEPQAITPHSRLSEDLGLDSIIVIELLDILNRSLPEKHKLAFTDTLTIATVADLSKRVATLMKSGGTTSEERV